MLRVLLGINALALVAALLTSTGWSSWMARYVDITAWVEPLLLFALGTLTLLRDLFWRLPKRIGQLLVAAIVALLALGQHLFWQSISFAPEGTPVWRSLLLALFATWLVLAYFELRARALPPALAETRLAALNARIRPHFLFNSLNAVLSLIRAQPRQAEAALESLAELFRAALRDPKELLPLSEEIALARQYLELEKLRLGERLTAAWEVDEVPLDLAIPPLMLQPLLENAVYHGIEPLAEGGTIRIHLFQRGDELVIEIANPLSTVHRHAAGNQMAVANIRERLSLYYDLEARLDIDTGPDHYLARIILPCKTPPPPSAF